MNRLWSAFDPVAANGERSLRGFFLGQFLALSAAVATLAAHLAFGPLFGNSVYLFCLPALLVCSGLGGRSSGLSATLILAAGAYVADAYTRLPEPERIARVALFLVLGAAVAYLGGWLRRHFRGLRAALGRARSTRPSCAPAWTPSPTPASRSTSPAPWSLSTTPQRRCSAGRRRNCAART